jgi:AraC-like DNA-binding protein
MSNHYSRHRDSVTYLTRCGWTAPQIAQHLGISPRHVTRIRTATKTLVHPKAPLLTEDELLTAKLMLEDGASYTEVERTLGRSFRTLKRNLPGYSWTREQTSEYIYATRKLRKLVDL